MFLPSIDDTKRTLTLSRIERYNDVCKLFGFQNGLNLREMVFSFYKGIAESLEEFTLIIVADERGSVTPASIHTSFRCAACQTREELY